MFHFRSLIVLHEKEYKFQKKKPTNSENDDNNTKDSEIESE